MLYQFSDHLQFFEYTLGVGCVFQFICQILPGPVFVVLAVSPQARVRNIVHHALVGYPHFGFVLPVAQRQLRLTYRLHVFLRCHKLIERPLQQNFYLGKVNPNLYAE